MDFLPLRNIVGSPAGVTAPRSVALPTEVTAQDVLDQDNYLRKAQILLDVFHGRVVTATEYADIAVNREAAIQAYGGFGNASMLKTLQDTQASVNNIQTTVNSIQADMLEVRQKLANQNIRIYNSRCCESNHALLVLSKELVAGANPLRSHPLQKPAGDYPSNHADLMALTADEMNNLADFYGESFGTATTPIETRRAMFGLFIGCPIQPSV